MRKKREGRSTKKKKGVLKGIQGERRRGFIH